MVFRFRVLFLLLSSIKNRNEKAQLATLQKGESEGEGSSLGSSQVGPVHPQVRLMVSVDRLQVPKQCSTANHFGFHPVSEV